MSSDSSRTRVLSFTEISTALTCQAQHDFRYGDRLAGSSLRAKRIAPILSEGRAWGAAVAAWHTSAGQITAARAAMDALDRSMEADAEQQREAGVHDEEQHREHRVRLLQMLHHYTNTVEPWPMDRITEREIEVPIPSRGGVRASSRYRMLCYLDATETDADGGVWLDEFKLRRQLTDVWQIQLSRQIRWYAWAFWQETHEKPRGVWVNERWNEAPKPVRVVQGKRKGELTVSHAKDQLCTADAYIAGCSEYGVDPRPDTLEALRARRWQQRVPIMFRDDELDEAGQELVSAAKLIHELDTGWLAPIRNARPENCRKCEFKDICPAPDSDLIDDLFERRPPKRELQANRQEAAA